MVDKINMFVKFNSLEDEDIGFDILANSGQSFSYLPGKVIMVTRDQRDLLTLEDVGFRDIDFICIQCQNGDHEFCPDPDLCGCEVCPR